MFSREAILENLLQQKKANKRKFAAWEAQQQDEQRKVRLLKDNPTAVPHTPCSLQLHQVQCT